MIFRVEVSPRAREDLDSLALRVAQDNLTAARQLFDEAGEAIERLSRFPRMGVRRALSRRPDTELRIVMLPGFANFILAYEVSEELETVKVLRFLDGRRDPGKAM